MNPATNTQPRTPLPRTPAVEEAARAGIDPGLVEHNLSLTHEQRIIRHKRALALVYEHKLDHLLDAADIIIDQNLRIVFCGETNLALSLEELIKVRKTLGRENDRLAARELRAIAGARAKKS
ncbi:MAG: hypothetical protein LBC18_02100 [Opitutaceae bacterium]|jgi:hypothetical protein|nr:hypothetical protein [Opitutaceae bacterium]